MNNTNKSNVIITMTRGITTYSGNDSPTTTTTTTSTDSSSPTNSSSNDTNDDDNSSTNSTDEQNSTIQQQQQPSNKQHCLLSSCQPMPRARAIFDANQVKMPRLYFNRFDKARATQYKKADIDNGFCEAIIKRDLKTMEKLVAKGANVNPSDNRPLIVSVKTGDTSLTEWLLDRGTKISPANHESLLSLTATCNRYRMFLFLWSRQVRFTSSNVFDDFFEILIKDNRIVFVNTIMTLFLANTNETCFRNFFQKCGYAVEKTLHRHHIELAVIFLNFLFQHKQMYSIPTCVVSYIRRHPSVILSLTQYPLAIDLRAFLFTTNHVFTLTPNTLPEWIENQWSGRDVDERETMEFEFQSWMTIHADSVHHMSTLSPEKQKQVERFLFLITHKLEDFRILKYLYDSNANPCDKICQALHTMETKSRSSQKNQHKNNKKNFPYIVFQSITTRQLHIKTTTIDSMINTLLQILERFRNLKTNRHDLLSQENEYY